MSDERDRFMEARLVQIIEAWDEWDAAQTPAEAKIAIDKMYGAVEASRLIAATPEARATAFDAPDTKVYALTLIGGKTE